MREIQADERIFDSFLPWLSYDGNGEFPLPNSPTNNVIRQQKQDNPLNTKLSNKMCNNIYKLFISLFSINSHLMSRKSANF